MTLVIDRRMILAGIRAVPTGYSKTPPQGE